MKSLQSNFIEQSKYGRNKWWTFTIILISSIMGVLLMSFVMNKFAVPFLKSVNIPEAIGKENTTLIIVLIIFSFLIIILKALFRKIHLRPFSSLINGNNHQEFRWKLYFKGILQWGLILFPAALLTDSDGFTNFLTGFNLSTFLIGLLLSSVALFLQTLWEELIFRGYLFQAFSRKFTNKGISHFIIGLLFAFAHLGYGIQSFLFSFAFSIVLTLIVNRDNGLERASGIHFINNFLLSMFFLSLDDTINADFDWTIDWFNAGIELLSFAVLMAVTGIIKFSLKKVPNKVAQSVK